MGKHRGVPGGTKVLVMELRFNFPINFSMVQRLIKVLYEKKLNNVIEIECVKNASINFTQVDHYQ